MTLIKQIINSIIKNSILGRVTNSSITIPTVPKIVNPITQGLKWQIASIQDGKTKSQLVTVDGLQGASNWFDYSGNGLDGNQTTSTKRPIYTLNELNGRPALVFDNIDDIINFPSILDATTTPFTLFVVAKFTIGVLLTMSARAALRVNGSNRITSNISSPNFSGAVISSAPQIYTLKTVDNDVPPSFLQSISINGQAGRVGIRTINAGTGTWEVGGNTDASIGEVIAYDRNLLVPEEPEVLNYLATKWGITLPKP